MVETVQKSSPRMLNPDELAVLVRMLRDARKWSQEQLAEISGLSGRTVQRVENGDPSGIDTRRALARAFEADDIDAFNKPHTIPTPEEITAARAKFEADHITLSASPLVGGRQLAGLVEQHSLDLFTPGFDMSRKAEEEFAALVNYLREYRDCHDLYQEAGKFEIYDALQDHIHALKQMGVSLRYAERRVSLVTSRDPSVKPMVASVLYLVTFKVGQEPDTFTTPRKMGIGWQAG